MCKRWPGNLAKCEASERASRFFFLVRLVPSEEGSEKPSLSEGGYVMNFCPRLTPRGGRSGCSHCASQLDIRWGQCPLLPSRSITPAFLVIDTPFPTSHILNILPLSLKTLDEASFKTTLPSLEILSLGQTQRGLDYYHIKATP